MGSINHLLHVPWFQFDSGYDLKRLYILQMAKVFVDKFALFFLPIYLFELGAGWSSTGNLIPPSWVPISLQNLTEIQLGMGLVALFFAVYRVATAISSPLVGIVMHRYGNRLSMTLGYAFFAFGIVLLHASTQFASFVIGASISFGIFMSFNHITEFAILAKNTHKANLGRDIGLSRFLMQLANMIAPLLGGLVIFYTGYQTLFLVGVFMLAIILIITQTLTGKKEVHAPQFADMLLLLKNKAFREMMISSIGRYINDTAILIWPIYLFILLGSVDKVGYLYAASFFLAMLVSMAGGAWIDDHRSNRPYMGSGTALAGLWIVRIFVLNPVTIAFVDAMDRLISNYHWLYFETTLLKVVKIKSPVTYLVVRSVVLSIFATLVWLLVGLLFLILIEGWRGLFILASVGVLFSLLLRDNMQYAKKIAP